MRFITAMTLVLLPMMVAAQQASSLKPNDFAYGMPLEVDGDGALYSFDLPTEVNRYSTRHDLGDLRIFNGYSEVVPHLLRPGVTQAETVSEPLALPFFPIVQASEDDKGTTQINIATDENGAVVNFWQRGATGQESVIGRYLIDASAIQQPLTKLLLDWDETAEGFLLPVTLESSNDLANWSPVQTSASLASLSQGGYRLRQGEIILPPMTQARYYRLEWPLGEKGIKLTSLQAIPLRQGDEKPRLWQRYSPSGDASQPGRYEFHVEGHFPFDRARVLLPQGNTVVRARLFSRDATSPKSPWREHFHGLLYNLVRDGRELVNDAVQLPLIDAPFWKLEIETDGGGIGRGEPLLELGWVPQRVYFVARGEAPFTLAFAAAGVERPNGDIASLLTTLEQSRQGEGFIKSALPGAMYELGGRYRMEAMPPPLPWQRWLLWATLSIGVLIVALMARSLYRQINNEDITG
jgi:hypothetical protein